MGKQRNTAVPSKNPRGKTTDPDGSSISRINNSRTAKKRTCPKLNKPNPGSTWDSDARALYLSRLKFPIHYQYYPKPDCLQARASHTCVIALRLTQHKPNSDDNGKLEDVGHTLWSAILWSASCMSHRAKHDPYFRMFTDDSKMSTRDGLIRDFQREAVSSGFSHCEVRVYLEDSNYYVPLFGGPLPESIEAS